MNYCEECGAKLEKNTKFCPECGNKVRFAETKTKFCSNCGEKIRYDAEICPKCKVRVSNPLNNSVNDKHSTILTAKNIIIVFLIIIIIGLVLVAPSIIELMTPYKEVDSSYITNHIADEKVQFDGEYVGTLTEEYLSSLDSDFDYVFKVGDEYVFVHTSYSDTLSGNEGKTFHLEGKFPDGPEGEKSHQKMGSKSIDGYWFRENSIELVD